MAQKLEEARKLYQTANADQRYVLESLFPELKESEGERIRKEIIEQINLLKSATLSDLRDKQFDSWITWLEKQGGQKPAWSEEDEKMLADACIMLDWYKGNNWWTAQYIKNWLKSIKERCTWKPGDEQMLALEAMLTVSPQSPAITSALLGLYEQLKKLREE